MKHNKEPLVSIIIPTLNRPESIVELVYQLLSQDYSGFEIIIVDQSRQVNRPLVNMANRNPAKVKYHTLNKTGTTGARNFGLAKATGEIIVFLDDDCRVDNEGFIDQHVSNYSDEKVAGVGGRVIDQNIKLNKEQTGPVCWVSKTGRIYPSALGTARVEINAPRGGNMSFRRVAIRAVGGFDERFSGNAMREETDFSLRVVESGRRIIFDPKNEVVHLALPFGGSREETRFAWYFHFFHNEMLFFLKHFPKTYLPILFARKFRAVISCMFFYGRGRPNWLILPLRGFIAGAKSYNKKAS